MASKPESPERARAGETPAFVVRPARPSDARSFLRLWRGVVAEGRFVRTDRVTGSPGHYRRRFRKGWTAEEANLVAVHRNRLIGHLAISREEHPVTRHIASIGMSVAQDWRRRGVGSALMAEAVRWARQQGVEKLALSVYPDNLAAQALYRKFGFAEEGRLSGHSKKAIGYRDEVVMGLWLIARPDGAGA
jgi:ribosomal protein S18 acetylase RimI-like enzyme